MAFRSIAVFIDVISYWGFGSQGCCQNKCEFVFHIITSFIFYASLGHHKRGTGSQMRSYNNENKPVWHLPHIKLYMISQFRRGEENLLERHFFNIGLFARNMIEN